MKIRDFIFFNILYPIFHFQIDEILNSYRLAQVSSVEISDKGLVYVHVNKIYPVGAQVQVYKPTKAYYNAVGSYDGTIEEVYASGKVISVNKYSESVILLTRQIKEVTPGLLTKCIDSKEFALATFGRIHG